MIGSIHDRLSIEIVFIVLIQEQMKYVNTNQNQ